MISKVITGKSFAGCCRYVCRKEDHVKILHVNGVREANPKDMAADFEDNRRRLPNKHRAVFHGILSFHPSDRVTESRMTLIACQYLDRLKITDTQFTIVKHSDKAHQHLHIIANLVNMKGIAISDSWLGLRGKKVAQALTLEHGLKIAQGRTPKLTPPARGSEEAVKEEIFSTIATALVLCKSFAHLENVLAHCRIDIMYKRNGKGEAAGISFRKGKYAFKGSDIHRNFSFAGFQKRFGGERVDVVRRVKRSRGLGL
ncbi:relaxase/mobilization nuclease domain-containing protein [Chitinophaga rhizosphaerae]|uniref:relaxase/mobilization nuclease domain-containing protein n=1 Tax=Chitinophaga rhizosphaerae TaxID=1864947 RepID=UPI000F804E58|nr:relaxase/mobilization nuclease domain-containing protein [Chitinophaga rhizosphaerae]